MAEETKEAPKQKTLQEATVMELVLERDKHIEVIKQINDELTKRK